MRDILKNNFPYSDPSYDEKFINKGVIKHITDFCETNDFIEQFFAKGSIIHGCMIRGSDVDHVRIRVNQKLSLEKKIELVDSLEGGLIALGVTQLKRIREDNYARVFFEWEELINLPNAYTKKFEVYPTPHIITAKNKKDWFRRVLRTGYSYTNQASPDWIEKMKRRIL
ncbi:hypothetical protein HY643_02390 [Candidatus Woesearchaeota archaeon]|nr:hypothetical protein [Candidatus Woesearchaeota archaeon]